MRSVPTFVERIYKEYLCQDWEIAVGKKLVKYNGNNTTLYLQERIENRLVRYKLKIYALKNTTTELETRNKQLEEINNSLAIKINKISKEDGA